jgi:hypothetical protein
MSGSSYLQVVAAGDVGSSPRATCGGFVALDVGALSSLAGDAGPPGTPTAPPRTPVSPRKIKHALLASPRRGRTRRIPFRCLLPKLTVLPRSHSRPCRERDRR